MNAFWQVQLSWHGVLYIIDTASDCGYSWGIIITATLPYYCWEVIAKSQLDELVAFHVCDL